MYIHMTVHNRCLQNCRNLIDAVILLIACFIENKVLYIIILSENCGLAEGSSAAMQCSEAVRVVQFQLSCGAVGEIGGVVTV